ncbi:MAG: helix-turn-helix transcriptional regulator [Christensenellales bacterium]
MRVDILFGIVLTLLKKGKCSTRELAEKFEVSTKTIQRYLLTLEMAGVPTISTYGRKGGTEISNTFELNKWYLSTKEKQRLLMHLQSSCINSLDSLDKQIIEKLNFNLPENNQSQPNLSPVIIDESDWLNSKNTSTNLSKEIMNAINEKYNLYINYSGSTTIPNRIISPYQFILKDNKWYLFGYCHIRKDYRLFKLSRINVCIKDNQTKYLPCTLTDEETKELLNNNFAEKEIQLCCNSTILPDIKEWLEIKDIKPSQSSLLLTGNAVYNKSLIYKLISLEDKIKVISPKELVTEMTLLCDKIKKNYS